MSFGEGIGEGIDFMFKMGALFFVLTILGVGGCSYQAFTGNDYEKEAIEHGFAIYHPETGEFTWKENK